MYRNFLTSICLLLMYTTTAMNYNQQLSLCLAMAYKFSADTDQQIYNSLLEQAEALIMQGADVNYDDPSLKKPLLCWYALCSPKITRFLLDHGARPNIRDRYGQYTPLHFLMHSVQFFTYAHIEESTALLIEAQAPLNDQSNKHKYTPLMCLLGSDFIIDNNVTLYTTLAYLFLNKKGLHPTIKDYLVRLAPATTYFSLLPSDLRKYYANSWASSLNLLLTDKDGKTALDYANRIKKELEIPDKIAEFNVFLSILEKSYQQQLKEEEFKKVREIPQL